MTDCATMPNFVEIARTAVEICKFQYYASLAWKCLFTPLFGGFGGTVPPNDVTHRRNCKKDRPWAEPRHLSHKPRVIKGWYFTYLWRRPHWSDVHKNLFSGWCSRRNHVCQVSERNFRGLRFYRGSNFPFSYWFLNGPYNSAALLRCLWYIRHLYTHSCPAYMRRCWMSSSSEYVAWWRRSDVAGVARCGRQSTCDLIGSHIIMLSGFTLLLVSVATC